MPRFRSKEEAALFARWLRAEDGAVDLGPCDTCGEQCERDERGLCSGCAEDETFAGGDEFGRETW